MPRNQLLDQFFALFRETPPWSIRPLRKKTQQPEVYLKDVLCRLDSDDSERRQHHILFLFSFCLVISPFLPPIQRRFIYQLILPFNVSASSTAIDISNPKLLVIVGSLSLVSNIIGLFLFHGKLGLGVDGGSRRDMSRAHGSWLFLFLFAFPLSFIVQKNMYHTKLLLAI